MKITVITATYNRSKLLGKLYDSLVDNYNSFKDIEWVIVDDGSEDDTKEVVNKWVKNSKFKIVYYYQDNQGKMKAINNGMQHVTGDIVLEVDSDDYLMPNALLMINKDYEELKDNVYGIAYKRKLLSRDNTVENIDNKVLKLFDIHNKYGYDFDMALTFRTEIRKKYEYILEKKEKFSTESRLYYKMDQDYDGMLFKDKEIVVCEYMDDGYSKNINKMFKRYPYGYYEYFKECLGYCNSGVLFKKRIYFVKHYILFSYLTKLSKRDAIKNVKGFNKLLVMLLIIPGYMKSKRF